MIGVAALAVAAFAGLRVRDALFSVAIAMTASLVTLPVTWYHYPVVLVPIGIALAVRHPRSRPWLAGAIVIADVAIGLVPLLWVAIALVVLAAWQATRSAPSVAAAA